MYIILKNGFRVIAQKISFLLVKRWFYQVRLFFATFWQNLKKISARFFRNFPKTSKLSQICLFLTQMSGFRENEIFFQKSGRAMFLAFFALNFIPNFGKIFGTVFEICRSERTDKQT